MIKSGGTILLDQKDFIKISDFVGREPSFEIFDTTTLLYRKDIYHCPIPTGPPSWPPTARHDNLPFICFAVSQKISGKSVCATMSFQQHNTSLITILSSTHGRLRREQRDISKRDLQRAMRYGTMERCWGQRWKVEYDGIIFITDSSRRREITA